MNRAAAAVLTSTALVGAVSCGGSPAASPVAQASPPPASATASGPPASASALAETEPPPTSSPVRVTAMPSAPASGVLVHLVAENVRWDRTSLEAPAGKTFTLELDNRDRYPPEFHNFGIATGPAVEDRVYVSPKSNGPTVSVFEIPGLPAGTYTFFCSPHAERMTGVLTVR